MMIFALIGFIGGFIGLWLWMQKRIESTQKQLQDSFKALSFDAMEKSGRQFLNLADATLQPLRESIRELEKRREGAYGALSSQIEGLILSEKELRSETVRLVQALRSPQTRGVWGEIHLRRVVEIAGLTNHCDFYEQKSFETDGRMLRPDLIVRLPNQRYIAIDAKTPLIAYLDASDAGDEVLRKRKLQDYAMAVRKHIKDLSAKEYWKQLEPAPEYVILFLPAESFFSAALQIDPSLIEVGADQNVIVATPTTLIAILRAVAHGWKQDSMSKNAKEMARLGQELYERIGVVCEHWNKVGKSLNTAVEAYNQSLASLETRVLVSARKLKESGGMTKELPETECIDKTAREMEV
jgi:DNA recombination protein RmuC